MRADRRILKIPWNRARFFNRQGALRPGDALLVNFTGFKLVMPDGTPTLLAKASWLESCPSGRVRLSARTPQAYATPHHPARPSRTMYLCT